MKANESFLSVSPALRLPLVNLLGLGVGLAAGHDSQWSETVIERGPHHQVIETRRVAKDVQGGETARIGRYTEVRNGMHYWTESGWLQSEELVELHPGGAAAIRGPHQVVFPSDLTAPDGISLLTPRGQELPFRLVGLRWEDGLTGEQRWLARIRACAGALLPPNQVLYADAFEEVWADVRYTYTTGGLEQDVILRETVTIPPGMDAESGLLQVVTEFLGPPTPTVIESGAGTEAATIDGMRPLADGLIDFGDMQITQGRAFSLAEEPALSRTGSTPVAKRWEPVPGGAWLIESVSYPAVRERLAALPGGDARTEAAQQPEGRREHTASTHSPGRMAVLARMEPRPGFVLDFILVNPASHYIFQTDQTYKVATTVTMSQSTTFHPGAILKFTTMPTAGSLTVSGAVSTPSTLWPRAVLTHVDDNSVGEPIGSGQPQDRYPYALNLYYADSGSGVQRLEIRHAAEGVKVYDPFFNHTVRNCLWRDCTYGVTAYYSVVYLQDLLMCDVQTNTYDHGNSSFIPLNPILTACGLAGAVPVIEQHPANSTANVGSNPWFAVKASGYGLTYQWYYNGASIPGAISHSYVRTGVQHSHAGLYHVVVGNDVGEVRSAAATLTVVGRPQIVVQPKAQTLPVKSDTSFNVGVIGTGPVTYQWYMDSTPLADGGRISGSSTFELNLSECLSGDDGRDFWVRVANAHGSTDSASARLRVIPFGQDRTYTSTTDFTSHGILINLNANTPGELRLNTTAKPLPFVNMACSGRGTVVRIDALTGRIAAEYFTAPVGDPTHNNPSRTTVDRHGNVWVGNRGAGPNTDSDTVTCFGIVIGGVRGTKQNGQFVPNPSGQYLRPPFEYNTCPDRDGDGLIRTSLGSPLGWDQNQTPSDEAILHYVATGVKSPRALAVDKFNRVWVGGWREQDFVRVNGTTGIPENASRFNLGIGGYGAVVDGSGILWSAHQNANFLLRYSSPLCTFLTCVIEHAFFGNYGLGIEPELQAIWHSHLSDGTVSRINQAGGFMAKYYHGNAAAQGVVVGMEQDVWVTHSLAGGRTVGHVRPQEAWLGNVHLSLSPNVTPGPTGLAIDTNGKVWVSCHNVSKAMRINPNMGPHSFGRRIGAVDLVVELGAGAEPYNYSDMTGFVFLAATSPSGIWDFVHDGGFPARVWRRVSWSPGTPPPATAIIVEVRAADERAGLPGRLGASNPFQMINNGVVFSGVSGRYLEVRVTLSREVGVVTGPALYDLTIHHD